MPQRYVSNKNESVRMFESDFMELFSHVHPVTPLVIYLPVIGYLLHLAIAQRGLSIGAAAGLFALGLVIWTLVEYAMHRWVFHYEPRSGWGRNSTSWFMACITIIRRMPAGSSCRRSSASRSR